MIRLALLKVVYVFVVLLLFTAGCQRAIAPSPLTEDDQPFDPAVTPRVLWPRGDIPVPNQCLEDGNLDRKVLAKLFAWTPVQGASRYEFRLVAPSESFLNDRMEFFGTDVVSGHSVVYSSISRGGLDHYVPPNSLDGWTIEVRAEIDGTWGPWGSQSFSFAPEIYRECDTLTSLVSVVAPRQVLTGRAVPIEFSGIRPMREYLGSGGPLLDSSDLYPEVVRVPAGSTAAETTQIYEGARLASFVPDLAGEYTIRVSAKPPLVGSAEVTITAVSNVEALDAQTPGVETRAGEHLIPTFMAVEGSEGWAWGKREYFLQADGLPMSVALLDDIIVGIETGIWDLSALQAPAHRSSTEGLDETIMVYTSEVLPDPVALIAGSLDPASAAKPKRWPGARIPYDLRTPDSMSEWQVEAIQEAIDIVNEETVLTLEPRTPDDRDYVNFVFVEGKCASFVGRMGGPQPITVGHCGTSAVVHEILHAAGVIHEHSRPDRDEHVRIDLDNVTLENARNFSKLTEWSGSGRTGVEVLTDYDFNSIMHYHATAFAIDSSLPTIERLDGSMDLGGSDLTALDIEGLALAYRTDVPTWELIEPAPGSSRSYTVTVGDSTTLWVEIRNTSTNPDAAHLEVSLSENVSDSRKHLTIPTGESVRTSLPLACTSEGTKSGYLRIATNSPFSTFADVELRLSCVPRVNTPPVVTSVVVDPATADINETVLIAANYTDDSGGPFECLLYIDGVVKYSSPDCPNPLEHVTSFSEAGTYPITFVVRDPDDATDTGTAELRVVNRRDQALDACNVWSVANSGGDGITEDVWDFSEILDGAVIDIRFDTFSIPDRFRVAYPPGTEVYSSGWRGDASYEGDPLYPEGIDGPPQGEELGIFTKSFTSSSFVVEVEGRDPGTAWDYSVRCRTP